MITITMPLLLGFLIGIRHALEPDHLAAIATLVTDRPGWRRGALIGASWGLGHCGALIVVAGALLLGRLQMPETIADALEGAVAVVLIVLGARAVVRAARSELGGTHFEHSHGGRHHSHAGSENHLHAGGFTLSRRPLLVGVAHGLAGSGALVALAVTAAPTIATGTLYIFSFGVGSVLGMMLLTGIASWPLERIAKVRHVPSWIHGAAGLVSVGVGIAWGLPTAVRLAAWWGL